MKYEITEKETERLEGALLEYYGREFGGTEIDASDLERIGMAYTTASGQYAEYETQGIINVPALTWEIWLDGKLFDTGTYESISDVISDIRSSDFEHWVAFDSDAEAYEEFGLDEKEVPEGMTLKKMIAYGGDISPNDLDVKLTLKRIDICDLLLACTCAKYSANDGGKKWDKLHDKLEEILDELDKNVDIK